MKKLLLTMVIPTALYSTSAYAVATKSTDTDTEKKGEFIKLGYQTGKGVKENNPDLTKPVLSLSYIKGTKKNNFEVGYRSTKYNPTPNKLSSLFLDINFTRSKIKYSIGLDTTTIKLYSKTITKNGGVTRTKTKSEESTRIKISSKATYVHDFFEPFIGINMTSAIEKSYTSIEYGLKAKYKINNGTPYFKFSKRDKQTFTVLDEKQTKIGLGYEHDLTDKFNIDIGWENEKAMGYTYTNTYINFINKF